MEIYKVLLVDDDDSNIDILRNALKSEYEIYVAKDGYKCIETMKKIKPNIVLLDVIMPEIDGYETLKLIKNEQELKDIPVIFLTALKEIDNKTKGFELGAVDYVTKPFYMLEIKSRIKTQIELQNSKNEIKDLLSKTLSGAIQMLMEILSISNPEAFAMSTRIKNLMRNLAVKLNLNDVWKYEMAGMLSMLGCYALPEGSLEKILMEQNVDLEIQKLYSFYPSNGAKLLSRIPRMEDISEIVNCQREYRGNAEFDIDNVQTVGAILLNHALDFEILKYQGFSNEESIMKMLNTQHKYNSEILSKLRMIVSKKLQVRKKEIIIEQLETGMIIEDDIKNNSGKIIIKKGMAVSEIMIEHLLLISRIGEIGGKVSVRVK